MAAALPEILNLLPAVDALEVVTLTVTAGFMLSPVALKGYWSLLK